MAAAHSNAENTLEPTARTRQRIGDYELLEEIGRGGMGVVWRARQVSLDRVVALKLLLAGSFSSEEARERFQREAQIVAMLRHPNIVTVHEIGQHQKQPFFSMDYIEGDNLSTLLRESLPAPKQAAEWTLTLAQAVAHAHASGIIHRDLKPANILIDPLDAPHLTDFGLAKLLDGESDLTLTGQTLGSASYMAPEQATGRKAEVTAAADIYALGAVLYHLLTGRPPFLAESVTGTLKQVLETEPVAPHRLNPSLPRDLETICLKCLEKSPDRRYASAHALADDLRCWLTHKPIQARPATSMEKAGKWFRRNPLVAGLTTLLTLALLGGLVVTLWQLFRAEKYLGQSRAATVRLARSLTYRDQREAEALLSAGRYPDGLMALARLVHDNPSNTLACARLFSTLTSVGFPWPVLPPLIHDAPVQYGAFTPDNRFILTASRDGWVHVWNTTSGVRRLLFPHDTARGCFALSSSGTRLATLATNGVAQVWELPAGNSLFETRHPGLDATALPANVNLVSTNSRITAVSFCSDGTLLATAGTDGRACLWRMSDGQLAATLEHGAPLQAAFFQPKGRKVLTVGGLKCRLWNISVRTNDSQNAPPITIVTVESFHTVESVARPVWAEFSPSGDQFLTVANNTVEVWDSRASTRVCAVAEKSRVSFASFSSDARLIALIRGEQNLRVYRVYPDVRYLGHVAYEAPINAARFRPNDTLLVTASDDGTARLYSVEAHSRLFEPMRHRAALQDALFDPGRSRVLTVSADHTARLWFATRALRVERRLPSPSAATLLELSPDGEIIAAAGRDQTVRVFRTADALAQGVAVPHPALVTCLAFHPDTRRLASGDEAGHVIVSDPKTGQRLCGPLPHHSPVLQLKWSSTQSLLAALSTSNVWLWDIREGQTDPRAVLPVPQAHTLDLSPDGSRLVVAGVEPFAQLFDTHTGQALGQRLNHPGSVGQARFSPDGQLVVTGGQGNAARVWNVATGEPVTPFIRPGADVTCLTFSPDSGTLLTGSSNGAVRLWDSHTGRAKGDLLKSSKAILSAEFSPDGESVLITGQDELLRLQHIASGLPMMAALPFKPAPVARFSANGRRLLVQSLGPTVAVVKSPAAAAPNADLLLAMTEFVLGQRLNQHGGWEDLTRDEFLARQRALSAVNWRLGPAPQTIIYR